MIKTELHLLLMIFLILLLLLSCCEGCRAYLLGAAHETVNSAVKTDFSGLVDAIRSRAGYVTPTVKPADDLGQYQLTPAHIRMI